MLTNNNVVKKFPVIWKWITVIVSAMVLVIIAVLNIRSIPSRLADGGQGLIAVNILGEVRYPFLDIYSVKSTLLNKAYRKTDLIILEQGIVHGRQLLDEFKMVAVYKPEIKQVIDNLTKSFDIWVGDEQDLFDRIAGNWQNRVETLGDGESQRLIVKTAQSFSQTMGLLDKAEVLLHEDISLRSQAVIEIFILFGVLFIGLVGMVFYMQNSRNKKLGRLLAEIEEIHNNLKDEMHRNDLVLQTSKDGFWVIGLDGKIHEVNDAYCRMVGYTRKELLTMNVADVEVDEKWGKVQPRTENILINGYDSFETRHQCKDGHIRELEINASLMDLRGERFFFAFMRDITERKHAERILQGSEEKWRSLTENLPDLVMLLDVDYTIHFVNRAISGLSKEQLIGKSKLDFVHPDYHQIAIDCLERVAKSGKMSQYESLYITAEGETQYFDVRISGLKDRDGNNTGFISTSNNITERKKAEERIRRFSRIFEDSLNEIFLFKTDTLKFIQVNSAALKNLGYSMEELQKLTPVDLKPKISGKVFARMIEPLLNGEKEKIIFETIHQRKDQSVYDVEVHVQLLHYQNESLFAAIILDITHRKKAEESMLESEKRFLSLFDSISDGIIICDQSGNITQLNQGAQDMFGYKIDEIVGSSASILMPEKYRADHEKGMQYTMKTGKGKHLGEIREYVGLKKDGSSFPLELSLSSWQTHSTRFVAAIVRDISTRKKVEEEKKRVEAHLRQQQKLEAVGTLAGGVAHEINNPITGIMNYARLISDRLEPASNLRQFAEGISKETERVATIVSNLLTYARQDKESHSPARIDDILNNTISLIGTIVRRDQIDLQLDIPVGLPKIKCRSQQIQQVLMNLLTNSRDALNERYPQYDPDKIMNVTVRPFEEGGRRWLRIMVEDHGTGIPDVIKERMFDPFYTTKDRTKGTGLGLSISLGIVKEHHGRLFCESVKNKYTRFYLELPIDNGWEL